MDPLSGFANVFSVNLDAVRPGEELG